MRTTRAHWLLVPLLLLIAACDSSPSTTVANYPYLPQFTTPSDVPPRLLTIPPAPDSAEYNKEISSIIKTQHKLTDAEKAAIKDEDHIRAEMIVLPVIGAEYTEDKYPAMYALLRHAASDAWRDSDYAEDYWKRQRPWTVDERVQLLVSPITRPSYPSGHSTTNYVWANVLTDLFPEKQDALFTRAHEIGMHRVAAGVHYPSDVEAGKRYAAFIYDKMSKTPQYKLELAAAQNEIIAAVKAVVPPPIIVEDPQNTPASMLTPAPAAPATNFKNLPVDCMHPQPGELQTKCQ